MHRRVARADPEPAGAVHGERPDIFFSRVEIYARGCTALDDIDLAVRACRRVDPRSRNDDGEHVVLVGIENGFFMLTGTNPDDAAVAAGAGPERAVRTGGQAPDLRRRGAQRVRELRPWGQRAVAIDQDAVRRAFQQLTGRADDPEGRAGGDRKRSERSRERTGEQQTAREQRHRDGALLRGGEGNGNFARSFHDAIEALLPSPDDTA